jgi:hypothetical protein
MNYNLIRKLFELDRKQDAYIDSLPKDISSAFFDNAYVESIRRQNDMLVDEAFGDKAHWVNWFLYEWKPGYEIIANDKKYQINDIEDFIAYLEKEES